MSNITPSPAKQVAEGILVQLGGRAFSRMTGAKNFVFDTDKNGHHSLQFDLPQTPNYTKNRINCVRVTLMPSDTYAVQFRRKHTLRELEKVIREQGAAAVVGYDLVASTDGIYCDDLADVFTRYTGLDTRFPRIIGR